MSMGMQLCIQPSEIFREPRTICVRQALYLLSSKFLSRQAQLGFSHFSLCQLYIVKIFWWEIFQVACYSEKIHLKTFLPHNTVWNKGCQKYLLKIHWKKLLHLPHIWLSYISEKAPRRIKSPLSISKIKPVVWKKKGVRIYLKWDLGTYFTCLLEKSQQCYRKWNDTTFSKTWRFSNIQTSSTDN